jgi:hypothetical protein
MIVSLLIEELNNLSSIIAIFISILALIVSIANVVDTRRSLELNRKQFKSKQTNFEIYLVKAYAFPNNDERYLLFNMTLTNKSELRNSFSPCLFLECVDEKDRMFKLQLPHIPEKSDVISDKNISFFTKQITMNEKESSTNWLLFSYKLDSVEKSRIDGYIVSVKDVSGVAKDVRCTLLRDLS